MARRGAEDPVPHDATSVQSDGISVTPQPELVAQVGSHNILRSPRKSNFAAYDVQNTDGEQKFLHLESYAAQDKEPSYYTGYWDGAAPLDGFLGQADAFFTRYAAADPEHAHEVQLVVSGDEGIQLYGGERPITSGELVEAEGARIGSEAERLKFLRVENSFAAFTWEPERTGFIVTPSKYPNPTELRTSLREIYDSSRPAVPTPVFQRVLDIVVTDAFQNPQGP